MRLGWGRLVVLLLLLVSLLQALHMFLLSRLERKLLEASSDDTELVNGARAADANSESNYDEPAEAAAPAPANDGLWKEDVGDNVLKDLRDMTDALRKSSVLDSSGEYKVVNALARSDWLHVQQQQKGGGGGRYGDDVTLATQCSQDKLWPHLVALCRSWDGPISISVFVTDENLVATLVAIAEMRQCHAFLRNNTSFHLVYPLLHGDQSSLYGTTGGEAASRWLAKNGQPIGCERLTADAALGESGRRRRVPSETASYAQAVPYPNNLLRNVARRNAPTEYVFVVDVDMVPSAGLRRDFVAFAEANDLFGKGDRVAYVVPVFEVHGATEMPGDKASLLRLVGNSLARPFYVDLCWKCQKYTNYDEWKRLAVTDALDVAYEVQWKNPWEPFYVVHNTAPYYDERFKQYGFNRISQVCELHIAGYKFAILNNAFLVHRGLKTVNSFHKRKDEEQEGNRLLFRQFKTELKEKYPDSSRRCY